MPKILPKLLGRGDNVAIECGRLVIRPASGRPVPGDWLADNRLCICREILELIGTDAYEYVGYATGHYGQSRAGGVTLQFASVTTGAVVYAIFNAELTRARSSAGKQAGSPLPKGRFRVGKRSHFYRFWLSTRLPVRRLSDFHDYMGRLTEILFTGVVSGDRIDAGTLRPMSINTDEIAALLPDNIPTSARQHPDNAPTRITDKKTKRHQQSRGLQPFSTTCVSNHGKTVIREHGYTVSPPPAPAEPKAPDAQSVDEWLADYDRGVTIHG